MIMRSSIPAFFASLNLAHSLNPTTMYVVDSNAAISISIVMPLVSGLW